MKAVCPWLTLNQMQKCLNKDSKYLWEFLMRHPFALVMLIFFILSGITLVTLTFLCDVKFPCTSEQKINTLTFGMNICLMVFIFIVIPCLLRGCLNCLFTEKPDKPEKIRVIVQDSPLRVKRTTSR